MPDVSYEGGVIRSRIRISAGGFREDGHVMQKNLENMLPSVSYYGPDGTGVRSVGYYVCIIEELLLSLYILFI